jgi:hypothetical protein
VPPHGHGRLAEEEEDNEEEGGVAERHGEVPSEQ